MCVLDEHLGQYDEQGEENKYCAGPLLPPSSPQYLDTVSLSVSLTSRVCMRQTHELNHSAEKKWVRAYLLPNVLCLLYISEKTDTNGDIECAWMQCGA